MQRILDSKLGWEKNFEVFLSFFEGKKRRKVVDSYQESLNQLGREQLNSLLRKGLFLTPAA